MLTNVNISYLTFYALRVIIGSTPDDPRAIEMRYNNSPSVYVYIQPVRAHKCATGRQLREIGIVVKPKSFVGFHHDDGTIIPIKMCLSFDREGAVTSIADLKLGGQPK